jgi:hypothetical protein
MTSKKFERIANYCLYITSTLDLGNEIRNKSEALNAIMIRHYKKQATIDDYNEVYKLEKLILESFNESTI